MNLGDPMGFHTTRHCMMFRKKSTLGITPQKHFLCTIVGPDSSYSPLEIHICWKVLREDRIEPPIHTEYLRWWSHNLDLHRGRCQGCEFFGHTLTDASKHCGAAREHDIAVEIFTDVHVTLHDGLEGGV